MIDIGGYRLHMHVEGEGTPTVILDAGAGVIGQSILFNQWREYHGNKSYHI